VMNSAYIYLPVLTGYKREEGKQEGRYIYTIEGGIIWFYINMSGTTPQVMLKVAKTTVSKGFGSDEFAYESAVKNFARNLGVATRDISEFKLSAPISEAEGGNISFKLGIKEGIKTDECFLVGEWVADGSGDLRFVTDGWARVGRVADNRDNKWAKSSAWAVKRGSWAPGMMVVEHPRLPIDIAVKPNVGHLSISKGRIPILIGEDLQVTDDYDTYAPGIDLDAQYNLGGLTGARQWFFLVGGSFAFPATLEFQTNTLTLMSTTPPFVWGLHGGFLKRMYLGQFAATAEAKLGARFFTVEQKFQYVWDEYKYTIKNNSVGLQFSLGLDYAASPDVNIGLMAGWRAFTVSDVWDLKIEPFMDTSWIVVDDAFPEIDHSGAVFGLYLHWTPPSLPFDPVSLIQGAMGR